jgi:hypothetical protein
MVLSTYESPFYNAITTIFLTQFALSVYAPSSWAQEEPTGSPRKIVSRVVPNILKWPAAFN